MANLTTVAANAFVQSVQQIEEGTSLTAIEWSPSKGGFAITGTAGMMQIVRFTGGHERESEEIQRDIYVTKGNGPAGEGQVLVSHVHASKKYAPFQASCKSASLAARHL